MDLKNYEPPARAIMVYGASGSGKTYSVAEILKSEPKSRYIYNEDAGLVTLKQAGVTKLDAVFAMAPKEFVEAVDAAVTAELSTVILDTISTFYDIVLRAYLEKEQVKLGEIPRRAYLYAMEWIERILYLCLDCINAGTNVVCLCHERTTTDEDRVFWGPALAGQLPERVLRKFHAVVRCVRVTAGTKRRHLFKVPDSPNVGKDLLDIVGHGIDNNAHLLLPAFQTASNPKKSSRATRTKKKAEDKRNPTQAPGAAQPDSGESLNVSDHEHQQAPGVPPSDGKPSSTISRRQKLYLRSEWKNTGETPEALDRFLKERFNTDLDSITDDQIAAVTLAISEREKDNDPPF